MEQIGSQGMDCIGKEWIVLLTGRLGCNTITILHRLSNFIQNHIPQGWPLHSIVAGKRNWLCCWTGRRGCTSCGASSASTAATGMHRGEPTNKAQPKQFYIEAYYAKMWDKQYSRMHKGGPTRQDNQNSRLSHFMQNCIPQGCLLYSTAARNRSPQKIKCLKGHKSLGSLFEGVL